MPEQTDIAVLVQIDGGWKWALEPIPWQQTNATGVECWSVSQ